MKQLIIFIVLSALIVSCKKESEEIRKLGALEGIIQNEFGQPIDGAFVEVESQSIKSNSIGKYSFEKLEVKEYAVTVYKENFLTKIQKINIAENETANLDFVLSAGDIFLDISDSLMKLNAIGGSFNIEVSSNADWKIKNPSLWILCSSENGEGNSTVKIEYSKNQGISSRTDTVSFISGSIEKSLIISQSAPIKIINYEGIIGNREKEIKDSVIILFNKPINIETIKSNWKFCLSEINYHLTNNNCGVQFSYPCAELGGNYPFTISVSDSDGNNLSENINISFYKSKLDIEGFITDFLLINNDKEVLISTFRPSRILKYSIESNSIIHSYNLSSLISPIKLSFNPFNSKVYIMGSDPNATYRGTTVDRPDVFTFDMQSNEISKAFTAPSFGTYPYNIPFNIGFTKSGIGILLLKSNETSGYEWKLIDCSKNDTIYYYPGYNGRSDENNFNDVHMNFDNTKLYLTKPYGSCNYGIFDGSTRQLSLIRPGSITRGYTITADRNADRFYARQLYDQFIIDLDGNMSQISYLDSRHAGNADFSYRENGLNIIYICESQSFVGRPNGFYLLDYNIRKTIMSCDLIEDLNKFSTTLDGEFAVAYKQNSDISSSIYVFETKYFYRTIE